MEEAVKSGDKEQINAATEALSQASMPLMQKLYADQGAAAGAEATDAAAEPKQDDGAVEAEFEEVKDDKK